MRRSWTLVTALLLAGCSLVTSYAEFDHPPGPPPICGRVVPAPPAKGGTGKSLRLVGVTSDFTIGDSFDGGAPVGFNIDGVCTCTNGGASSCILPTTSTNSCDDKANLGIDNGAATLLDYLFAQNEEDIGFNGLVHAGKQGFLVEVQDYDGSGNDPSVTVAVFNISGIQGRDQALYDGTDLFLAELGSFASPGGGSSQYFTTTAYVRDGVLVAPFSRLDINFLVGGVASTTLDTHVQIPFRNALLVGPIEVNGETGLTMLHAQVAGRVPQDEMLKQAQRLGVCSSKGNATLKTLLCNAVDITTAVQGPTDVPCDAISFVLGFSAVPAQRAPLPGPPVPPSLGPCPGDPPLTCP